MRDASGTENATGGAVAAAPSFSLLGGPLYRFGRWLGLVGRDGSGAALGMLLGWLPWLVLMFLAAVQGQIGKILSLTMAAGHIRLLVVIPLLFVCEGEVERKAREFVAMIVRAGVTPPSALPALDREIGRIRRWSDSWIPDMTALLAAALTSYFGAHLHVAGQTAALRAATSLGEAPLAAAWYWLFCLPLFRFLIFRWLWRLAFWWRFLWSLSRSQLHLVPTHPDGVGGLGYLEIVQKRFALLAFAISTLAAAAFAEEIASGLSLFEAVYPEMAFTVLLDLLIILVPPCLFAFRLRDCQERGLRDYMMLASRYVGDFERKWLAGRPEGSEPLLGTSDLQSLADLGNSVNVIRNMRYAPISTRLAAIALAASLIPMLPVFLFKYPVTEIVRKLFMRLTGL